jgi:acylphosphatase
VQGVYFRQSTLEKAGELGVKGTVRNADDGSVEIQAEAHPDVITEFISWCHTGPAASQVSHVETHEAPLKNFFDFRIIR